MWGEGVFLRENPLPSKDFQEINQVQGFSPDLAGCNRKCFNSTWMVNFQMFKLDFEMANICWIAEKAREFQKNTYLCIIDSPKPLTVWITTNYGTFLKRWQYQSTLPAS